MANQSFTEFKSKRAALGAKITELCNTFSDEFGVKVERISIENHYFQIGMKSEQIISVNITTDT
jgi:hypothetical protein